MFGRRKDSRNQVSLMSERKIPEQQSQTCKQLILDTFRDRDTKFAILDV